MGDLSGAVDGGNTVQIGKSASAWIFFIVGLLQTIKKIPGIASPVTGPDFASLLALALIVGSFIVQSSTRRIYFNKAPPSLLLVLTLFCMASLPHAAISGFVGANGAYFITTLTTAAGSILLLSNPALDLGSRVFVRRSADLFMAGILVGITVPYVIAGYIGIRSSIFYVGTGRYQALLEHPNQVGIIATIICFYFSLSRKISIARIIPLILGLVVCILSVSKLNLALCVTATLIGMIRVFTFDKKYVYILFSIFAFVFLLLFQTEIALLGSDLLSIVAPNEAEKLRIFVLNPDASDSVNDRNQIWALSIQYGLSSFPLGVGPSSVAELLMGLPHSHNFILHYFLTFGIFGIFAVISLPALIIYKCIGSSRIDGNLQLGGALLMGLFAMLFSDSLSTTVLPFYFTGLVLLVAGRSTSGMSVASSAPPA